MSAIKKYLVLLASVIIMICLGGVYGFSVYVPPLISEHGLSITQTQTIFGFTITSFAIVFVVAGIILKKIGPRLSAMICSGLFTSGYLLASFSGGNFILILIGLGVLSGSGIGFGYIASLTTPLKWFPKRKGIITGVSVAGFGGGAVLLSLLVNYLLSGGMPVLDVFRIIALSYGAAVFLSSLALSLPLKTVLADGIFNLKMLVKDKVVWVLLVVMFLGTLAGLIIIGNIKPIGIVYGLGDLSATLAVSFFAIGNSLGRIMWGKITDLVGGEKSITFSYIFSAIAILFLIAARGQVSFIIVIFLIGMGFGANFVLFATEVCHIYGIHNLENIYPSIHLSYGVAGVISPIIGGYLIDLTGGYTFPILLASLMAVIGLLTFLGFKRTILSHIKR
jgi:MFS transporter, OFA family, oxalate/formate antiporter